MGMARRFLVDGMNVIGSRPDKWWNDPDRAMRTLAAALDEYVRVTGDEVTVVFDKAPNPLPETRHAGVAIAARKGRNAADYEIVSMVECDSDPSELRVVTSDKALREKVEALGARIVPSRRFRDRVDAITASQRP